MTVVLMKKITAVLSDDFDEVVIGDSSRQLDAIIYDADGAVQDITGWSAQVIGTSDDLPGVSLDVVGEIVSPASGGTFRWTRVGDFLTQIGEKSSARFVCRVKWTTDAGLEGFSDTFGIKFVVPGTGEDTNMNAAAVEALAKEFALSGAMHYLTHDAAVPSSSWGPRSSGFIEQAFGPIRHIQTPTGANKVWSYATRNVVEPGWLTSPGWSREWDYRMILNPCTRDENDFDGDAFMGVQVGAAGTVTPWTADTLIAGSPTPFIQLRYNFALSRFEVALWPSEYDTDEVTPKPIEVYATTYNPEFTPDNFITEFRLHYVPAAGGASQLFAYLNGQLALSLGSGSAGLQSLYGKPMEIGPGYFVTNGSNAAAQVPDAIFFTGRFYHEPPSAMV